MKIVIPKCIYRGSGFSGSYNQIPDQKLFGNDSFGGWPQIRTTQEVNCVGLTPDGFPLRPATVVLGDKMANRDIPDPVKRQLRQEAGFGCCVCGHPFIEYHHVVPFAVSGAHNPDDMIVLCPIHHHQCTVEALDVEEQRKVKTNPFNRARGFADGQLVSSSRIIAVEAGSNQFIGAGFKFVVDGEPLLSLKTDIAGRLLLSVRLYDPDDGLLLLISDNEWISGDPLPWDIEFGYNVLTLRRAERKVSLEINARSAPVTIAGELWRKRQNFSLRRDSLKFNGVIKDSGLINLGLVGQSLVVDTVNATFSIVPDTRLKVGMIVSWPDPVERLQKGIEAYNKLCREVKIGMNELCPCGSGRKVKHCHQAPNQDSG